MTSTWPEGPAYCGPIHRPMKVSPRSRNVITTGSITNPARRPAVTGIWASWDAEVERSSALIRGVIVWEIPLTSARAYSIRLAAIA